MLRDRIADVIYSQILTKHDYYGKAGYVAVSPMGRDQLVRELQMGDNVLTHGPLTHPYRTLQFFGRFKVVVDEELARDKFRIAVNI